MAMASKHIPTLHTCLKISPFSDTPPETLMQRLELAWEHDPIKALKLICNLRGVRGTGKSDNEGAYTALPWLHNHHPKTLACNVASFADFGYYKDLLEILFRLLEGPDARKLALQKNFRWKIDNPRTWRSYYRRFYPLVYGRDVAYVDEKKKSFEARLSGEERSKRVVERGKRVIERFNSDPDFMFLHDRVSDLFADHLRSDMKMLDSGEMGKLSLAAKWCPSLNASYDKTTLLCETIAKKVFSRDEYPEYEGMEEDHYTYHVKFRLKKKVLTPLRKALELPEVYIGANKWGSIPYNRVASVAMKIYEETFMKHDKERFQEYLENVKAVKAKIGAGTLLPHQIIEALDDDNYGQVAELQWKRMVDDISRKGKLNNCPAVSDVSGSMYGVPMEVSVALGILVSELSEEPWKGKLITFSENPKLQAVEGNSLIEKIEFVRRMDWGMNVDGRFCQLI